MHETPLYVVQTQRYSKVLIKNLNETFSSVTLVGAKMATAVIDKADAVGFRSFKG